MELKTKKKLWVILLVIFLLPFFFSLNPLQVHALEAPEEEVLEDVPTAGDIRQSELEKLFKEVSSPSECGTKESTVKDAQGRDEKLSATPRNCLFLEEPIGGKPNYDLYIVTCVAGECKYERWGGGSIPLTAHGPVQAILTSEPGKEYQGPFGLLYNYLGLIYAYMSGLIVGVAVLFVVIGGIQMTTAGGDTNKFDAGKGRIVKAIVGIILWFTASLILYTINPTFFAF